MKPMKTLVFLVVCIVSSLAIHAQGDAGKASQRALLYADSLDRAYRNHNWDNYSAMSYPGVIKYYGGMQGFREYIQRSRSIYHQPEHSNDKAEVIQMANEATEWQCVIRKSREAVVDGQKALVISYLIGQSTDGGNQWKYVDIAGNSVDNVIYLMPDVFNSLTIPHRQILYEKDVARFDPLNGIAQ